MVSIVSVNYDQPEVTCEMLESLRKVTYSNFEILIVDNASPTSSPYCIKEKYPEVQLLLSEKNLGFAGGNNIALKLAKGDYVLLLNNDTEVRPDFLESLVQLMESNREIGIVSSKILYFYEDNIIEYAGSSPINPITSRGRHYGHKEIDKGQFNKITETCYPHGACMMIRKSVLEELGLLYEGYFLYYEELDFAERVKRAGYKIYFQPNSTILHKESISTGKNSVLKTYYMNRNRLLFLRRNSSGITFLLAITYFFTISFPKNTIKYLFKSAHLSALFRGVTWNICNYNINKNSRL
ncbi:dTDP-Rha--alpha-D-GlcNAc-pyrophosphate polyprenol alpha-3-L-rhamnosyltransferase [Polaribacter glomeratus]|uniref:dTDP-Rha--alpha-D-GlcNAc-pyrophosphate polyprenol alpha-3-L-rhamnosyltransferase n=1 Tax=Polaribacter glomeratus TaxID=102 RepID=A0A2S7WJ43_9FLAO|nr:dTDP-Rha--alpha-D-GlcNAc-pyrophosphate polyprenol alpha-3-L-rhamnosyltransferase [Polaribacter glomeratus]